LDRFDALISKIILMYFSTKKHFENQRQPYSYTDKISNSTSIKNITAGQATFFSNPSVASFYTSLIYIKNGKEKGIGFFFFGGGGIAPSCPYVAQWDLLLLCFFF